MTIEEFKNIKTGEIIVYYKGLYDCFLNKEFVVYKKYETFFIVKISTNLKYLHYIDCMSLNNFNILHRKDKIRKIIC